MLQDCWGGGVSHSSAQAGSGASSQTLTCRLSEHCVPALIHSMVSRVNSYSLFRALQAVSRRKDSGGEGDSWNSGKKALASDPEQLAKVRKGGEAAYLWLPSLFSSFLPPHLPQAGASQLTLLRWCRVRGGWLAT